MKVLFFFSLVIVSYASYAFGVHNGKMRSQAKISSYESENLSYLTERQNLFHLLFETRQSLNLCEFNSAPVDVRDFDKLCEDYAVLYAEQNCLVYHEDGSNYDHSDEGFEDSTP
jgi:hypothetical protein